MNSETTLDPKQQNDDTSTKSVGQPKIGNGDRAVRRANMRLSKEAHKLCINLCLMFMKKCAKDNLKFDDEATLVLFNEYEAKWHGWLNKHADRTKLSVNTKKMFETYLLRYIDQTHKAAAQIKEAQNKTKPTRRKNVKKD